MTEPDLVAVQQLAPPPSDESLTRTWYRITQLSARPPQRHRHWIPVTAAAAVLLLAAASLTILRVGPGRLWPVASTSDAVTTLYALADTAAAGPAAPTVHSGQFIYVQLDGWAAGFGANGEKSKGVLGPQPRHIWYDPDGMVAVKITDGTKDFGVGGKPGTEPGTVKPPTGLLAPTPQWLAALPTDPDQLLAVLRNQMGSKSSWTVDHELWDAMAQLYSEADVMMSPQTRSALLRAAARMTGLSVREVAPDLVAIRQTDRDSGVEILFQPSTGRAVGRAEAFLGSGVTIERPADAPDFPANIVYQTTWTQSIVDSTAGS